jgi:HKD family nuclease
MLVPSDDYPDGSSALQSAVKPGSRIRAAVAFVTSKGVAQLSKILAGVSDVSLEITARAADATEPEALLELRDALGAEVMVVIGRHAQAFHPKLWLVERGDELVVLSGSGNLTAAGLTTNDEQFEMLRLARDHENAAAQLDRFERLTRNALPLDQVMASTIWHEWLSVRKQQQRLRREIDRAARLLNERDPLPDRSGDKALLIEDLQQIYEDAVAADLPRADGERYYPTRLLVAINRARDGERDPVKLVVDTIRRPTDGLGILLRAGLVELTIEWLVLDESKPYHDLFSDRSIELARARVAEFEAGTKVNQDGTRAAALAMTAPEITAWFERRLAEHPNGYALPVLHDAKATLLSIAGDRLVVSRDSGTLARPPLRRLALFMRELANGGEFKQSDLRDGNDRDSSVVGPLLADLPNVAVSDGVFRYTAD